MRGGVAVGLLAGVVCAAPASAQLPADQPVNAADAERMIAACKAFAAANGWTMQIAILNETGDLIRFEKMDGAQRATGEIALAKARTTFRTGRTTRQVGKMDPTAARLFDAVTIPGGMPVEIDGRLVAVVGASGSKPDNDEACAAKAVAAAGPGASSPNR